jgi:thiol-disulfide isomerase/thioredoxin
MKRSALLILTSLLTCLPFISKAEEAAITLKAGDPAPALQSGKFVQGEPVQEFAKGTVYVVEFWATWCGPCKATIPHLNELSKKYSDKNVVFIGQDCWENTEDKVEPFIKEMGDKMTYRVALDDKSKEEKGAMAKNWMMAAGQNGIPCAFIVNKDSKIAWIGHPGGLDEKLLDDVIAGTFDVAAFAKKAEEEKAAQLASRQLQMDLNAAMKAKDWAKAETALAAIGEKMPEDRRKVLDITRMQILAGQDKIDDANKLGEKISESNPDNAMLQIQLAYMISTTQKHDGKPLSLSLAEKSARAAIDKAPAASKAMFTSVLAKILFQQDKKDEAVQALTAVLPNAPEAQKSRIQKELDAYSAGHLPE